MKTFSNPLRASRAVTVRAARSRTLRIDNKLVLKPTGSGDTAHLGKRGDKVVSPPEYELREGKWDLGRADPSSIVVSVPTVSTVHAQVEVKGNEVTITDVGSTNGTFRKVEGSWVQVEPNAPFKLTVGEEVIFGDENLARFKVVEVSDSPKAGGVPIGSEVFQGEKKEVSAKEWIGAWRARQGAKV